MIWKGKKPDYVMSCAHLCVCIAKDWTRAINEYIVTE